MQTDIFGLPVEPAPEAPAETPAATEVPEETQQPQTGELQLDPTDPVIANLPEAQQPVAPEATETPTPEATTPQEPAATEGGEERKYANKYTSVKALEQGYREVRDLQRRTAERANQYERYAQELATRGRQVEQMLQQAMPVLQRYEAELRSRQTTPPAQPQVRTLYDEGGNAVQVPVTPEPSAPATGNLTPEQVQALVDQQVQARVAQATQTQEEQRLAQQAVQEAERAIYSFYERHPEIEIRGEVDNDLYVTVDSLNRAWQARNEGTVDVTSPESLDLIYEISQRPALRKVLEKQPHYFDDEDGMRLARFEASLLEGETITQQQNTVPASAVGQTVGQRKPAVERASTGNTTPPNYDPNDPWLSAVAGYQKEHSAGEKSVFGV